MPWVITRLCRDCVDQACVEVCPVDCIYEHTGDDKAAFPNQLYIDPEECIDCGVCEPECPPEAILPDTDPTAENWLELNRQYSESWPNITRKGDSPEDADAHKDEAGKFDKYFSANPGQGS